MPLPLGFVPPQAAMFPAMLPSFPAPHAYPPAAVIAATAFPSTTAESAPAAHRGPDPSELPLDINLVR